MMENETPNPADGEPVQAALPTPPATAEQPAAAPAGHALRRSDLVAYAESTGLEVPPRLSDDQLADLVEQRLRLVDSLSRESLVEIVTWAGTPPHPNADKVELVRRITQLPHTRFPGLGTPAVRAIALIRGCRIEPDDDREAISRKIRAKESFFAKFRRKRRAFVGKLIAGMVGDVPDRTLPEDKRPISLGERIEHQGIVRGLKGGLNDYATDFIRQRLDEIEARIDRKIDEIDARLGEWRDKEIVHRIRIIRITLMASIVVALLSLGYTYLRAKFPGWLP